ncbi:Abi family protein [Roseateles sp. DC23W]|uniref:Abi family protein n=1 Tax=Pelomonas dachongensis TaxID=3299029 RepID=A0ABW7EGP6_9BURK
MILATGSAYVGPLVDAISHARLSNYRSFFSPTSDNETLGLYQWNDDVSGCLFRAMSLLEIVLRNQFHKALGCRFGAVGPTGGKDWFNHLNLNPDSRDKVKKITHRKRHGTWLPRNPMPSPDDVVSKLTFGFWSHLLDVTHDATGQTLKWGEILVDVVPGHRMRQPTQWRQPERDALFARLDLCNEIRNRIAHHEPIWKLGPLLQEARARSGVTPVIVAPAPTTPADVIDRLSVYYDRMMELLKWLSPDVAAAYRGCESDARCRMLLTNEALDHYRNRRTLGTVQLDHFLGERRLAKVLKYASRHRQPVALKRGDAVVGHWTSHAK